MGLVTNLMSSESLHLVTDRKRCRDLQLSTELNSRNPVEERENPKGNHGRTNFGTQELIESGLITKEPIEDLSRPYTYVIQSYTMVYLWNS